MDYFCNPSEPFNLAFRLVGLSVNPYPTNFPFQTNFCNLVELPMTKMIQNSTPKLHNIPIIKGFSNSTKSTPQFPRHFYFWILNGHLQHSVTKKQGWMITTNVIAFYIPNCHNNATQQRWEFIWNKRWNTQMFYISASKTVAQV